MEETRIAPGGPASVQFVGLAEGILPHQRVERPVEPVPPGDAIQTGLHELPAGHLSPPEEGPRFPGRQVLQLRDRMPGLGGHPVPEPTLPGSGLSTRQVSDRGGEEGGRSARRRRGGQRPHPGQETPPIHPRVLGRRRGSLPAPHRSSTGGREAG
jgi:hypothetical protein